MNDDEERTEIILKLSEIIQALEDIKVDCEQPDALALDANIDKLDILAEEIRGRSFKGLEVGRGYTY